MSSSLRACVRSRPSSPPSCSLHHRRAPCIASRRHKAARTAQRSSTGASRGRIVAKNGRRGGRTTPVTLVGMAARCAVPDNMASELGLAEPRAALAVDGCLVRSVMQRSDVGVRVRVVLLQRLDHPLARRPPAPAGPRRRSGSNGPPSRKVDILRRLGRTARRRAARSRRPGRSSRGSPSGR